MFSPTLLLVMDATFRSRTPVVVVLAVVTASMVRSLAAPRISAKSLTSETAPLFISMPLIVSSVGPVMASVLVNAPVELKYERVTCVESLIFKIFGVPVPVVPFKVKETTPLAVGVTVFWAVVGGTWTRQVGQVAT